MITNQQAMQAILNFGPCDRSITWMYSLDQQGDALETLRTCWNDNWMQWLARRVNLQSLVALDNAYCRATRDHYNIYNSHTGPIWDCFCKGEITFDQYQIGISPYQQKYDRFCDIEYKAFIGGVQKLLSDWLKSL